MMRGVSQPGPSSVLTEFNNADPTTPLKGLVFTTEGSCLLLQSSKWVLHDFHCFLHLIFLYYGTCRVCMISVLKESKHEYVFALMVSLPGCTGGGRDVEGFCSREDAEV